MRLFDYAVKNAAPIRLALDQQSGAASRICSWSATTRSCASSGTVGLHDERIALQAAGDANLGILQGFFRDVRGSGRAELTAAIDGPLRAAACSRAARRSPTAASATSRCRNALDAINGVVHFDARGIRLDDVTATMGGGQVQFGGRIGFDGYLPGDLERHGARRGHAPARIRKASARIVDADLALRGTFKAPTLGGTVTVKSALVDPAHRHDRRASSTSASRRSRPAAAPPATRRRRCRCASTSSCWCRRRCASRTTWRGWWPAPTCSCAAPTIGRCSSATPTSSAARCTFEGRRYRITRGTIDFTNPTRIEPFFDVEAETHVRVPGQTYRVTVRARRHERAAAADAQLGSAAADGRRRSRCSSATCGATQDTAPELRALQNPNQTQTDILTTRATQALAGPISSRGRQGRRADLRRRHLPAHAVARRSVQPARRRG